MQNRLHDAAADAEFELQDIQDLISKNKHLIATLHSEHGTYPLDFALQSGKLDIILYLISLKAPFSERFSRWLKYNNPQYSFVIFDHFQKNNYDGFYDQAFTVHEMHILQIKQMTDFERYKNDIEPLLTAAIHTQQYDIFLLMLMHWQERHLDFYELFTQHLILLAEQVKCIFDFYETDEGYTSQNKFKFIFTFYKLKLKPIIDYAQKFLQSGSFQGVFEAAFYQTVQVYTDACLKTSSDVDKDIISLFMQYTRLPPAMSLIAYESYVNLYLNFMDWTFGGNSYKLFMPLIYHLVKLNKPFTHTQIIKITSLFLSFVKDVRHSNHLSYLAFHFIGFIEPLEILLKQAEVNEKLINRAALIFYKVAKYGDIIEAKKREVLCKAIELVKDHISDNTIEIFARCIQYFIQIFEKNDIVESFKLAHLYFSTVQSDKINEIPLKESYDILKFLIVSIAPINEDPLFAKVNELLHRLCQSIKNSKLEYEYLDLDNMTANLLAPNLQRFQVTAAPVSGDGSCFYHSIIEQMPDQFFGDHVDHKELFLRQRIAEHIRQYKDQYLGFILSDNDDEPAEQTLENYCKELSNPAKKKWADNVAITAFSRAFNVTVVILSEAEESPLIVIKQAQSQFTIYLGHVMEMHYVPLKKTQSSADSHPLDVAIAKAAPDNFQASTTQIEAEAPPAKRQKTGHYGFFAQGSVAETCGSETNNVQEEPKKAYN